MSVETKDRQPETAADMLSLDRISGRGCGPRKAAGRLEELAAQLASITSKSGVSGGS